MRSMQVNLRVKSEKTNLVSSPDLIWRVYRFQWKQSTLGLVLGLGPPYIVTKHS